MRVTRHLKGQTGAYAMAVARELRDVHGRAWFGRCVVRYHKGAFLLLDDAQVEAFGQGMAGRAMVDSYARILSGPAWVQGLVSDGLIHRWAGSQDLWWRRAALVSTVAFNTRGDGGAGDAPRTLAICRMLVDDKDPMVYKALSWALRALARQDPEAARGFVAEHKGRMAAQARREVMKTLEQSPRDPSRKP